MSLQEEIDLLKEKVRLLEKTKELQDQLDKLQYWQRYYIIYPTIWPIYIPFKAEDPAIHPYYFGTSTCGM